MRLFSVGRSMKKKLAAVLAVVLFSALLAACGPTPEKGAVPEDETRETGALYGLVIVVDAGHGGFDIGTQGARTRVPECDVNLAIARLLEEKLKSEGARVVMTREDKGAVAPTKDEDMEKRAEIIRAVNPDIMVSIHQNRYDDPDVTGPQVFYLLKGSKAEALAKYVQQALNGEMEIKRPRTAMSGQYKILRPGTGPSIIVECGFLSSPKEEELLTDSAYQEKLVLAIVDGLKEYAGRNIEISV